MSKKKRARNKHTFTDLSIRRLRPRVRQYLVWDKVSTTGRGIGQQGLSVLVSPGGTKSFRVTYYLDGRAHSRKLGRVGELDLASARELAGELRGTAYQGVDPKEEARKAKATAMSYEQVVDLFIELYAMPRQRTWLQTERVLKRTCAAWLKRPITGITKGEAQTLIDGFLKAGHGPKAHQTLTWLRTLWKWSYKRDFVAAKVMDDVEVHYERKVRDRVYSDAEIKTIWRAADKLLPIEGGYIKLLLLLAPRKSELVGMRWAEVKDGIWTTPHERTKSKKTAASKRTYTTPLPPLARRIFKSLPKRDDELVFPGKDGPLWVGSKLRSKLIAAGAPKDFSYHAVRHTVTSWLQDEGHDLYDRALVLNHASAGGVTAGYSHGVALDRKRALLIKWADHVEAVVMPKGVKALR